MQKLTYLDESLRNGQIVRWPNSGMPLKIYIAPFRWYKAKDQAYSYQAMVMQALDIWQRGSAGKVSFQVVNTLNESQINLDWKRVERTSLGHCYFNFDSEGRLYSAEVQIGLSDGIMHSQYQDENEVLHTIIHEIGHSIGLGHSPFKSDIMYVPHQYGALNVSQRDKDTLKWMYILPFGKSIEEVAAQYQMQGVKSYDQLIYNLTKGQHSSEFEDLKNAINQDNSKKLAEDQDLLADIGKYNMSLQKLNIDFKNLK